jgi:hypothetical protein
LRDLLLGKREALAAAFSLSILGSTMRPLLKQGLL